ncbi:uroporphyrinogen decarboxylase/cobalamine-independent methonine synthase family protein [Fodinicola feengrottensis]|uniref:hypothetical protein n=1 Tax=Fodinicola feengrottensis TaxID=435914 RepID=UPI002441A934|nr:hypothetical protein [Fodinicola feengrottensis]
MTYEQAWDEAAAVQAGTPTARWPVGAATGIGSMPGTDVVEATATVLGELPDFPHLPELPGRGAGADLIGRSTGILVELPVEVAVTAWRMASRPGRDTRRIADLLARDLDTLSEQADGYSGPLKIQVAGPWTLAGQGRAAQRRAGAHRPRRHRRAGRVPCPGARRPCRGPAPPSSRRDHRHPT